MKRAQCLPLFAFLAIIGSACAEDSVDVKELLERMKKMEAKMAAQDKKISDQEKTIADLKTSNTTKATASQQVDKALANSSTGAVFFHDPALHKRPIKIGGYLDVTYQYAFNQPTTGVNNERVYDRTDNNEFNVHLAQIYFDATAQEKGQAGFRIDLAYGSDANLFEHTSNTSFHFVDDIMLSNPQDDFSLLQAYIDYIVPVGNGLRMKVGKFVTPVGYEVIQAQDNWNATRSFIFGKALPATHTGIGFEYQVYSNWKVAGYFVNGWDCLQDNNEGKTGIVQSVWSPAKWLTWTVNGVVGNEKNRDYFRNFYLGTATYAQTKIFSDRADEDTRYLVNTILTFSPWEKWDFALEGTYGLEENASLNASQDSVASTTGYNEFNFTNTPDAEWWGVAGYMKYKFLPAWYLAVRGEYLNDYDGSRTDYGQTYHGRQELYSGTATLSYSPVNPFEIRLEYRYDASSRDVFATKDLDPNAGAVLNGHGGGHAGDGNPRDFISHQDTLTLQFLYKF